MNPLLADALRRNAVVLTAVVLLTALVVADQLWFRPTAARYARALKEAAELGMPVDPSEPVQMVPPRLFALVTNNSMPAAQAQEAANSGGLTAEFLGALTERMGRRGIAVTSTEPGPTTQDARSIQVRAHVRMRGHYSDLVMLLDDFAHDRLLFGVDRFNIVSDGVGGVAVEMWASRLVLKTGGAS